MKQVLLALLAAALFGYFLLRGGNLGPERRRTELLQRRVPMENRVVPLTVVYSPDKDGWVREAANQFADERKDVQIKLVSMGSLTSVDAILNQESTPTVWMPGDMGVVNYLNYRWKRSHDEPAFPTVGLDAPSSLIRSPLVMVIWESRFTALAYAQQIIERDQRKGPWVWACQAAGERLTWADLLDTDALCKKWNEGCAEDSRECQQQLRTCEKKFKAFADELPSWGKVKFNHANPSTTTAGMQTLLVLAHEYFDYPAETLTAERINDDSFLSLLLGCESSISEFPESTEQLTLDVLRHGPKRFDIVSTYENVAITELWDSPVEKARIYYPGKRIAWSDHPAVLLDLEPVPSDLTLDERADLRIRRRQAARDWIAFLRDRPSVQRKAIKYGFRPTLPLVREEIKDPRSPFNRFRVVIDLDQVRPPLPAPSGEVVDALIGAWLNR